MTRLNRQSDIRNRRGGNVLILVVAVLVLMVLIGTAYIQAARNDQTATSTMNENNIDMVVTAEVGRVQQVLLHDLVGDDGVFLNGDADDEPYDYMNENVDKWIASTWVNGSTQWPRISEFGTALSSGPNNYNNIPADNVTTTQNPSNTNYVDADGDGIRDSRFIDAITGQIGKVRYVTALRVIDLAALVNINIGTSQINYQANWSSPPSYSPYTDAPRIVFPSEMDIGWFLQWPGSGGAARIGQQELRNLLGYRMGMSNSGSPSNPSYAGNLPTGYTERATFWVLYGKRFGEPTGPFRGLSLAEELKLRARNGLNSPDRLGTQIDPLMPTFLREDRAREATWKDNFATIADYLATEPRHQITTISKTAELALPLPPNPLYPSEPARVVKVDLNTASEAELSTAIKRVYDENTPAPLPANLPTTQAFANQLAANIKDYADADNQPTRLGNRYGLEALPFITEVYAQSDYQASSATGASPTWTIASWDKQGHTGYAVEIRNPFRKAVSLQNVFLSIGGQRRQLSSFGPTTLAPDEYLVIYSNTGSGSPHDTMPGLGELGAQPFAWDAPGTSNTLASDAVVKLSVTAEDGSDLDYQTVTCKGVAEPGNSQSLNYSGDPAPIAGAKPYFYKQRSTKGNAQGINMMAVQDTSAGTGLRFAEYAAFTENAADRSQEVPTVFVNGLDDIGDDDKAANPTYPGPGDAVDPFENQFVIRDDPDDLMWQTAEIGQIAVIGMSTTQTIPAMWADSTNTDDFYIDLRASAPKVGGGDLALPHGAVLMDRLTTLSPANDGFDSDGDPDTSDAQEAAVMGRINVNNVDWAVLYNALPIPEDPGGATSIVRANIVQNGGNGSPGLSTYRWNSGARPAGLRTDQGFASLSEFYYATANVLGKDTSDNWMLYNTVVDFTTEDPAATADGITDDREEQMMPARWLGQVCTTRSDVYAVYILVRGYDVTLDTNNNGQYLDEVPVEQKRVVAILDRSSVTSATGRVKVLAVMSY